MGVYDYNATGLQKTKIARLCIALKISEPLEEYPMSYGVAGELMRKLAAQWKEQRNKVRRQQ